MAKRRPATATHDPGAPLWAPLLGEAARQAGYDRPPGLHAHADGDALLQPERLAPRRAPIDPARAGGVGVPRVDGDTLALSAVDGL